ncbi:MULTISPECIES: Hsp20/alpha crystallin family protein [unclassified Bradyrhizobium]|uniref:Hsp20/alpha crystallin family protein n=1 Tax=unclassified Bradyrhizobium TaxID=2631580 RepID=UPI0028E689C4|nr:MULTISPECIES: Hsp20/alpha crystallin family protein [unclassified Bradyrhizobium]
MTKDRQSDDDTTGVAGLTKIARGLSDLFNVLSEFDQLPRRGRHEKDGRVMEYSFNTRTLREAAGERSEPEEEPQRAEAPRRRAPKPSSLDLLEPVTDIFHEADEIVILFELPGVERKDVRCLLDGDILLLEARTGERLYRKEMLIEEKLAGGTPQISLRNGVLEVRLTKSK